MLAMTNVGVKAPVETLVVRYLNDGRYAVTFRQRDGRSRAFKHWTNLVTAQGMGAILAELPLAARDRLMGWA